MTGPNGNSQCFPPETLNVPRGEAEENIEEEVKQNSLFRLGPVIKHFVVPLNSKREGKKLKENHFLDDGWHTNLLQFQGTQPVLKGQVVVSLES